FEVDFVAARPLDRGAVGARDGRKDHFRAFGKGSRAGFAAIDARRGADHRAGAGAFLFDRQRLVGGRGHGGERQHQRYERENGDPQTAARRLGPPTRIDDSVHLSLSEACRAASLVGARTPFLGRDVRTDTYRMSTRQYLVLLNRERLIESYGVPQRLLEAGSAGGGSTLSKLTAKLREGDRSPRSISARPCTQSLDRFDGIGASQPTSRAGHRRLRAAPRRDWARR